MGGNKIMYEIAKKGNEVVYCKITQINYSVPENEFKYSFDCQDYHLYLALE